MKALLAIIFSPFAVLTKIATLYLMVMLAAAIASMIYWPTERWLVFPVAGLVAVNMFSLLIDLRSWVFQVDESLMFLGKVIRDKELKEVRLAGRVRTQ